MSGKASGCFTRPTAPAGRFRRCRGGPRRAADGTGPPGRRGRCGDAKGDPFRCRGRCRNGAVAGERENATGPGTMARAVRAAAASRPNPCVSPPTSFRRCRWAGAGRQCRGGSPKGGSSIAQGWIAAAGRIATTLAPARRRRPAVAPTAFCRKLRRPGHASTSAPLGAARGPAAAGHCAKPGNQRASAGKAISRASRIASAAT
jgi:hypothetical protein